MTSTLILFIYIITYFLNYSLIYFGVIWMVGVAYVARYLIKISITAILDPAITFR